MFVYFLVCYFDFEKMYINYAHGFEIENNFIYF